MSLIELIQSRILGMFQKKDESSLSLELSDLVNLDVKLMSHEKKHAVAELLTVLARLDYKTGDYRASAKKLQSAIALSPDFPSPHKFLGIAYVMLNNPKNAILQFNEALRLDPAMVRDKTFTMCYGVVNTNLGNHETAVSSYASILQQGDAPSDIYLLYGRSLQALGRLPEAIAILDKGKVLFPNEADVHFELAKIYISLREFGKALIEGGEISRIEGEGDKYHKIHACVLREQGIRYAAKAEFAKIKNNLIST